MEQREAAYRGCLLGLAVGDAMGYTIDKKTWDEICTDYGPNGLLGYDLVNGCAEISSYTQIAAFVCNGMLLGITRADPDRLSRYVALSLREWAKSQQVRTGERTFCWLSHIPQLRHRNCMDTRILDSLSRETLGTPETPVLRSVTPGVMTAAAMIGLCWDPERLSGKKLGRLAAETVAYTHGEPETFLSGVLLAYIIAGILEDPELPLSRQFPLAIRKLLEDFEEEYPQARKVAELTERALSYARDPELTPLAAVSMLECTTAAECLAGAVYACSIHPANFDEATIAAVNHSGRSAAVGAITGAILGTKLGSDALPEFYLECLEPAEVLEELAQDLAQRKQLLRIFDDSWDQKYVQGQPSS